jgi:hypothetical protein
MVAPAVQAGREDRWQFGAADTPPDLRVRPPVSWQHCVEVAATTAVALSLSLTLPLATTVFALLLFGVLHNYFELRYVVGRFSGLFAGRLAEVVLVGLTAIVVLRLLPLGSSGRLLEILAGYGLLGVILVLSLRDRPSLAVGGSAALLGAVTLSLTFAEYHFVAITHLHNVLPLVFLWEWTARGVTSGPVRTFRLLHLTWALALPAAILTGVFGSWTLPDLTPAASIVGDVDAFVRGLTPPGDDSVLADRLLIVFALLQLMHYYVWCRFFPSVGTEEAVRSDAMLATIGMPTGRRLTGLAILLAGLTMLLLWADFWRGRSLYGALAGYHAYLEYALLLLFILSWRRR